MITRVVLIGPTHYVRVRGIAAPTVDAFETPLGHVPVDAEALSEIADLQFVIAPTRHTHPSTLSKWSCRFCKLPWDRSEWCRSLSAMRLHRTSRMCCAGCGADRRR